MGSRRYPVWGVPALDVAAPRAGKVLKLHFARGDRVPEGAVLAELSGAEPSPGTT